MIGLSIRYFKKNKKQSLTIITAVGLASILFFSVGILFSSFREYLIGKVIENNDYHVKIIGDVSFEKNMTSLKENNGEYYIKFDNIYKSYEYTEKLCHVNECEKIIYNNKLFSLYGIGDDNYLELFMSLIIGIVTILSISVFFIIYNAFQMAFVKKKRTYFCFYHLLRIGSKFLKYFYLRKLFVVYLVF